MNKNNLIDYILTQCKDWAIERRLNEVYCNLDSLRGNIHEEYSEYYRARANKDVYGMIDAIFDSLIYVGVDLSKKFHTSDDREMAETIFLQEFDAAIEELPKYNIDLKRGIDETFKEINSRTGKWNEALGKWKKYTTDEAKALWYKADYKKALIDIPVLPKEYRDLVPKEYLSGFIKIKKGSKVVDVGLDINLATDLNSSVYQIFYFD